MIQIRMPGDLSSRRRRLGWVSAIAVSSAVVGALMVQSGPAGATGQSAGTGTGRARMASSIRWHSCGARLDCARVRVPLDWARPHGPQITLAVIRHRASRPRVRIGTLFFNPGGPGVSGVETIKDPQTSRLLDEAGGGRFDVVSWDTRGSGASSPVTCFRDPRSARRFWGKTTIPTTAPASRSYLAKAIAYARRCGRLSGRLLAHISTADTVRDLDYLRSLMHQRQITYIGWSYGTFLGQTYANMFPHRVRAMVLDGVVDAVKYVRGREASIANIGAPTNDVVEQFELLCQRAGPKRCALAGHGSVKARVDALLARVKRAPLPAPSAKPAGRLTYGELLTAFFPELRNPGTWPDFARDLEAAVNGDGSALATKARQLPPEAGSAPAPVAIGCADSPARQGPRAWPQVIGRLTHISPLAGPVLGWWLWAPCAAWPAHSADRYTGPWNKRTRNPILVVGTTHDPNTSYANARVTARRLGNAVLLTHVGYGHVSLTDPSACVQRATTDYLTRLRAPRRGTVCQSNHQPFDPRFGEPAPVLSDRDSSRATSRIAWRPCGTRLQCARVRVPLDWAHPGGPDMSLRVIRHLASRPARRIGSMFVNGGGAAGSVELVRSEGARYDALGQGRFDVVGWDLRGTSGTAPTVHCFADERSRTRFWAGASIPTTRRQESAYLRKTIAYSRRCGRLSGRLLAHISTADDARDLDFLRRLVGDRRLTYWAVSYGTFLGQTYANMFPRRVRAMALDGLVDPRIVIKGALARFANTVSEMDSGLRRFSSVCQHAGRTRCMLAGHGSVMARVARLLARLRHGPIPAPTAKRAGPLRYGDVLLVLFATLTNPAQWPALAANLDQAARGDGSALANRARAVLVGIHSAAADSQAAITCTDSPARQPPRAWPKVIAHLTQISRIGGPFVAWTGWAPCASWPARSADSYTGPWNATTRHPILVIGTTFDPVAPYANARRVTHLLGNAILLTHAGYGHTSEADPSACIVRDTSAYLVHLITPRTGTVCASDRTPFDPNFGR
jgi:pimeloyl-ACP methyl ester carboxylesterase